MHLGYKQLAGVIAHTYASVPDNQAKALDVLIDNMIAELRYQPEFNEALFRDSIFSDSIESLASLKGIKELEAERTTLRYQVTQGNVHALEALTNNSKALLALKGL